MKKKFAVLLVITMVLSLLIPVYADDDIKIIVNGKSLEFDVKPEIVNGRTLVPLRRIFEALVMYVKWDSKNNQIKAHTSDLTTKIQLSIGESAAIVNGEEIKLDAPAMIKNGRTLVPVRFIAESIGADVKWDENNKAITINELPKNKIGKIPGNVIVEGIKLPKALGEPQLTKKEIEDLVGKNPEILRDKINTAADMLQYMIVADYDNVSGDTQIHENGYTWHHNRTGASTIRLNKGNCGATASFVNYLLNDDYEEVGFIVYSATRGGHVYNYIKQDNKYYVIDFLQYVMADYKRYNYSGDIVNSLEEYPDLCKRNYGRNKEIKIIVSYTAEDVLPIANNHGVMKCFPKGTNVKALYETPEEGVTLKFAEPPQNIPNWDKI